MRRVNPRIYLVAETIVDRDAIANYLASIGAATAARNVALDAGAESLIEAMGRLCYRSWEPGLNPNVTKIREDRREYLANILKSGHGSVLEHGWTSWIFADVSRVFTHELVRHRVGTAFSQESLRYVRLTDLGLWLPKDIEADPEMRELFETTFKDLEAIQVAMAKRFGLDEPGVNFGAKKALTSTMRRLAPLGLATTIGVSFNHRSLRHLIELRTAESAEAEIRAVFDAVAQACLLRWPDLYQDFTRTEAGAWVPTYSKV